MKGLGRIIGDYAIRNMTSYKVFALTQELDELGGHEGAPMAPGGPVFIGTPGWLDLGERGEGCVERPVEILYFREFIFQTISVDCQCVITITASERGFVVYVPGDDGRMVFEPFGAVVDHTVARLTIFRMVDAGARPAVIFGIGGKNSAVGHYRF